MSRPTVILLVAAIVGLTAALSGCSEDASPAPQDRSDSDSTVNTTSPPAADTPPTSDEESPEAEESLATEEESPEAETPSATADEQPAVAESSPATAEEPPPTPLSPGANPFAADAIAAKRGFSGDQGVLSPYTKPAEIDGTGRKLLAIYMVGSDLEEGGLAGSIDLWELLDGYARLPNPQNLEVVVAFGGANKEGWRGMKLANILQLWEDLQDGEFGNESGPDAYLYRADGAHMGDESTLELFLDYLGDGYVNFDQRFLTLWDHGGSYLGFGNDTNFNGDALSLDEIGNAFLDSGAGVFDLIGFDACLMASVEVARFVAPHADYMIASEELEPGHGWLWSAVIEAYAREDSIVEAGREMVDNFVQDVHEYKDDGKTLSLLDLSRYDDLVAALDPVLSAYGDRLLSDDAYSDSLVPAAVRAQSFNHSEKADYRTSIDLMHFARLLAETSPDQETKSDLDELMETIEGFVVHSNHDGSSPNSFGIAIDAPENKDQDYSSYKVSDRWLDLQDAYEVFRLNDSLPPLINTEYVDSDGVLTTVHDENLATVTTVYGFIEPIGDEEATAEEFFMVVAEEQALPAGTADEYWGSAWNQWWFTIEYDPGQDTAWIPAFYSGVIEEDGRELMVFTAEVDYYRADKDYRDSEFPYDWANLKIVVHDDGEYWNIVDHYLQTYQILFSGPDDQEGTVRFDKATYRIKPGDKLQFSNFGFSLEDPANDGWFYTTDGLVTFVQEPVLLFEFLEFVDQRGEVLDYYYAAWAEDASGNATLGELIQAVPVVDSPFGNMRVFVDPTEYFEVQTPQAWIEEEPDAAAFEIFVASEFDGNGTVVIYFTEEVHMTLAEYADLLEPWFTELGADQLTRESVTNEHGYPAVLFEGLIGYEEFLWLAYLGDDGVAIDISYWFPVGGLEAAREMVYYSLNTFTLVD